MVRARLTGPVDTHGAALGGTRVAAGHLCVRFYVRCL